MAQATRSGQLTFSDYVERALREGAMWALMCVALYLVMSLASYSPEDPGWSYVGETNRVTNAGGRTGAWFADVGLYLFGYFAYLLPLMVAFSAWVVFRRREEDIRPRTWLLALRWTGFLLTLAAGCGLAAIHFAGLGVGLANGPGGGLGQAVGGIMRERFGLGTEVLLVGTLLVGFTLFSGISWQAFLYGMGDALLQGLRVLSAAYYSIRSMINRRRDAYAIAELPADLKLIDPSELAMERAAMDAEGGWQRPQPLSVPTGPAVGRDTEGEVLVEVIDGQGPAAPVSKIDPVLTLSDLLKGQRAVPRDAPRVQKVTRNPFAQRTTIPSPVDAAVSAEVVEDDETIALAAVAQDSRPPLSLLDPARKTGRGYSDAQIEDLSRLVEVRLKEFGVTVQVVAAYPGPVVTLFELQLAPGTKSSKISGLSKDLARALSKISVRVVEVIPGKSLIGIEIPNEERETVFLSEILGSSAYQEAKSPLTLALGTNISGEPVVVDLARMPHALIAGTTGSGKSVAINAMILSLLYKDSPKDVRLIMVDPKMLELSIYEGIPHLLTPVVTDMKEAANALRWCVGEMERRYRLMAALGVRNIGGYNRKVADAEVAGTPLRDPLLSAEFVAEAGVEVPTIGHLPYIVVIIDELADMMMVVGKKVEELIARLAQKARASGIHLMLATQRPSVDVLTGLIKANIPTRISFQVSSRIDSRTVLDQMGAEALLGHGDMLYLAPGGSIPQRVHGAFVDDHEVHNVVNFLKAHGAPDYIEDILREPQESLPGIDPEPRGDVEDTDPLFDEAVQIVVEGRRASISGVQRRLKIGYNRAARMIEEMERIGIVGPAETNGNREVLVPPSPRED
jgi:S-DNA-T family DNA segregation ATPase FtsK/SpoIIIE